MIKILIADDHPLVRQALVQVLRSEENFDVVAEAGDGEEAVKLANELMPDVVIMDINMPKINGIETTRILKKRIPEIAVVVLTIYDDSDHVFSILEAGADAYLTKKVFGNEVVRAVYGVASGETILASPNSKALLKEALENLTKTGQQDSGEELNYREIEILKLISNGKSNKDIAGQLGLSVPTVKNYLVSIFSKLGVSSRTEAAIKALKTGIVTLDCTE